MNLPRISTLALLVAAMTLAGCGRGGGGGPMRFVRPTAAAPQTKLGKGNHSGGGELVVPPFDATQFVSGVDNPYFPLVPGSVLSYSDGTEIEQVEVIRGTKKILGVATTIVHDQVFVDGSLTEDTFDWYAQDGDGNVWYFGEDTKELDHGTVVSTEGSWEAGVNGATAGIIMLAEPKVGDSYAQEDAPDVAADKAKVVSLDETVTVAAGTFTGCIETLERTPLEPNVHEYKYYAPGVGLVLEVASSKGRGRLELTGPVSPSRNRERPALR